MSDRRSLLDSVFSFLIERVRVRTATKLVNLCDPAIAPTAVNYPVVRT